MHITQEHFPGIDFSHIETEEDLFTQKTWKSGEHRKAAELRALKFLKWLLARWVDTNRRLSMGPTSTTLKWRT